MKKILWIALAALAGLALVGLLWRWIGEPMVNFVKSPEAFRAWVADKGAAGWLVYMGMCMIQVIIAFIPGEPFEIAGGYAFGWLGGTLLSVAGATLGSALTFSLVKRFGHRAADFLASREKVRGLSFLRDEKKLHLVTFLLFFLPGTPKDLLTYCAALTSMKLGEFLMISALARIPSVVTSAVGGHALGEQRYLHAILIFAATLAVSAAGLWIYNRITARRRVRGKRRLHRPKARRVYRKRPLPAQE